MAEKDVLYHELLEALQASGCAVCRLARGASDSYIRAVLYEGVTDVKLRETLRNARGLCFRHSWSMARKRGAVLGTAIVYRDVINTLLTALEANVEAPPRLFGKRQQDLSNSLAASADCPACVLEKDAELRTVRVLLSHAGDPAIAAAYGQRGLCLPHFRLTLERASQDSVRWLSGLQAEAWARLRGDLDELIRKHDYRFRSEAMSDAEAESWERAVAAIVGEGEPRDQA